MKVEAQGHTNTIQDTQADLAAFVARLTQEYPSLEKRNIIVDLLRHENLSPKQINALLPLSKTHKKFKKTFVIVANVDYNSVSQQLVVVPTLPEANDIIEMEEMERDLGF